MKSIRAKILVWMMTTLVVSLLVVGFISIYLNYSSTNQTLEQTLQETATIAADRVNQELSAYTNVAVDAGCIARLAADTTSLEEKQNIVSQRASSHNFLRGNIIGADGISLFDGNDYSDRSYFQAGMNGKSMVSEPVISKITGKVTILIAAPLWNKGIPDTKIDGVIYFAPNETFLNDIVTDINMSENCVAYIINEDGYTIADNTLDTIMVQNIEEEAKNDASLSSLAAVHTKMRNGETGFAALKTDNQRKFLAYAPIPNTEGWSIAISAPQSDFMKSTNLSVIFTIIAIVIAIFIAILIAIKLARDIGMPMKACAERLVKLSQGDLKSDVPTVKTKDETKILADATSDIVSTMDGIISDVSWGLNEMANGKFDIDSQVTHLYVGDFKALANAMYGIMEKLTGTLVQINVAAEQVASGSSQMASSAQALSQGATEQASAIEELLASITEVANKMEGTTEHAQSADEMAVNVNNEMKNSNEQMQQMMHAMSNIDDHSQEIGKIIKVIEDIAFQTNILALNAAVEAARAGSAGKGFAVVADEVRNLAAKSAEASKNTSVLIEESIRAVENGTQIAEETAQSLVKAVEGVNKIVDTIDLISEASKAQTASMSQISTGVDQVALVVQTNSATAEESAATSEELSGQAQMLKDLVNQFELKKVE